MFEDEITIMGYKTEPTGNHRFPSQIQWIEFLKLVKEMRYEQKRETPKFSDFENEEEYEKFLLDSYDRQCTLELKVDNMIKEFLVV